MWNFLVRILLPRIWELVPYFYNRPGIADGVTVDSAVITKTDLWEE